MITRARAMRCVTHHHACDCREYDYQQAFKTILAWSEWPDKETACDLIGSLCKSALAKCAVRKEK